MKLLIIIFFLLFCKNLIANEYNFKISALNVPFASISLNFDTNKISTKIKSKGFVGFFYKFETLASSLFVKNTVEYNYKRIKKNYEKKLYAFITHGNAQNNFPNLKHRHGYSKIIKSDLNNVIDPLTAVKQILKTGYKKCNFKSKIFDGEEIYILKLIDNQIIKNSYKVCTLKYQTVSGHKLKREKKLNNLKLHIYYPLDSSDISNIYFKTTIKSLPLKMISTTK
ncbi:MAG: hypothetical protein CMI81_03655 [Candidatus Pelagibacter sp.]|nr:hypothetical protein [Candidatus Pelagibacter sp.]OUV96778.1 MAG: hypothetical protein CBD02_04465 [Candidatus Pelagibacter sp. TMED142]|tara:strand:- start:37 stop:711 length:675 start_codon:yes stop_codon:yes gene_type:complete